jgi:hypothetical protein
MRWLCNIASCIGGRRLVHDGRYVLLSPSAYEMGQKRDRRGTNLALVPGCCRNRQNVVLYTASSKVIENCMIRHVEHTIVVLDEGGRIQNGLAEESRKSGRVGKLINGRYCAVIKGVVLGLVKVQQVFGDFVMKNVGRGNLPVLGLFVLLLLRRRLICLRRRLPILGGGVSRCLRLVGEHIVGVHLNVVDQIVAKVYSRWQVRRCLHLVVHQESDVVSSRENIDRCCKDTWMALTTVNPRQR